VYRKDVKLFSEGDTVNVTRGVEFVTVAKYMGIACGYSVSVGLPESLKGITGISFSSSNDTYLCNTLYFLRSDTKSVSLDALEQT